MSRQSPPPALAGAAAVAALCGLVVAGACLGPRRSDAQGTAGQSPGAPRLAVLQAELWYSTTPGPGVWAELKLVVDNPLVFDAQRTVLRLSPGVLDDFALRGTEPALLAPPLREPDGRYALAYPPPLDHSQNWYRVFLVGRRGDPGPVRVAVAVEGPSVTPDVVLPAVIATPRYVDRTADPFLVVPERLVGWLPGQSTALLPLYVVTAFVLAGTVTAGCLAAFWLQRR